jgi:hypothetical protein
MAEGKSKGKVNEEEIEVLVSAEEFLDYFEVDYDGAFVRSKRIALMRLFHQILHSFPEPWRRFDYRKALRAAYHQLENGNELALPSAGCAGCTECDD